jgi:hypothetical protein
MGLTVELLLDPLYFRVCIVYRLVQPEAQTRIFLGQSLAEVLLVADVLGSLIGPEAECATSTLHDDVGSKATENTRLVVFGRAEVRDDGVVRLVEL